MAEQDLNLTIRLLTEAEIWDHFAGVSTASINIDHPLCLYRIYDKTICECVHGRGGLKEIWKWSCELAN